MCRMAKWFLCWIEKCMLWMNICNVFFLQLNLCDQWQLLLLCYSWYIFWLKHLRYQQIFLIITKKSTHSYRKSHYMILAPAEMEYKNKFSSCTHFTSGKSCTNLQSTWQCVCLWLCVNSSRMKLKRKFTIFDNNLS